MFLQFINNLNLVKKFFYKKRVYKIELLNLMCKMSKTLILIPNYRIRTQGVFGNLACAFLNPTRVTTTVQLPHGPRHLRKFLFSHTVAVIEVFLPKT